MSITDLVVIFVLAYSISRKFIGQSVSQPAKSIGLGEAEVRSMLGANWEVTIIL
jgi:hypothetical protein